MILLVNPRATRPKNRRFPLSVMAIGAALPPDVSWEIVDGNVPNADPLAKISSIIDARRGGADPVEIVAFTVMPGPQLVSAVPLARELKKRYRGRADRLGRQLSQSVSGARAQRAIHRLDRARPGRADLRRAARCRARHARSEDRRRPVVPRGRRHSPLRHGALWVGPDELPAPPYHKIDVADYLRPTFLGRRSGVYQASIGCPVRLQVLRRDLGVRKPRTRTGTGPHGRASRVPRARARRWTRCTSTTTTSSSRSRTRASSPSDSRPSGFGGGARRGSTRCSRYSDDTWRLLRRSGTHDDVLRRRVWVGRSARRR